MSARSFIEVAESIFLENFMVADCDLRTSLQAVIAYALKNPAKQRHNMDCTPEVFAVAEETGISVSHILDTRKGSRSVSDARAIAAYVMRAKCRPFDAIGRILGGRGHQPMIVACRKVASHPELLAVAQKILSSEQEQAA